ncbi:hypothetical protein CDO31_04760 [Sinorhizobium meliloti]|nr:hypothetical protein CDO31_04760 [Sinorhizobium meliloti]
MVEVKPITVFLGSDLAHDPFASVDAKLRPLNGVVVDDLPTVFRLDDVAFLAVGDLQDFVAKSFHSSFARMCVLRGEVLVLNDPPSYSPFCGHSLCRADFPQALADGELFENGIASWLAPLRCAGLAGLCGWLSLLAGLLGNGHALDRIAGCREGAHDRVLPPLQGCAVARGPRANYDRRRAIRREVAYGRLHLPLLNAGTAMAAALVGHVLD